MARQYCLVFFLLIVPIVMHGQWVHTGGPGGVYNISSFSHIGSAMFATTAVGVFRSTNNGVAWVKVDTALSSLFISDRRSLAADGETLFVGTSDGVFRSSDYGANWTASNIGLTYPNVSSLALSVTPPGPNYLVCGTYNGVFVSTDGGAHWTESTGLTNKNTWSLVADGPRLVMGTGYMNSYYSTNRGLSWTLSDTGLPGRGIRSLCTLGDLVFAGTDVGIFRSTNIGSRWIKRDSGLTSPYTITSLIRYGTWVFAASFDHGVFLSQDSGASWTDVSEGLTDRHVWSLYVVDMHLVAGTDSGKVWRRPLSELTSTNEQRLLYSPDQSTLHQNYPNPFNPSTTFSFALVSRAHVVLKVYDNLGREISTITSEDLPAGQYSIPWNARGLPSGVYYYRLESGATTTTKKLLLLR